MNASDLPDETLFEGALKCRTPVERAAYLDQACAGQPALRRNLEALLQAHDQSGEFLEPTVAAERPTIKLDLAPEEVSGTVIGRYKLLQKIGEGGMGIVYMAEQTEPVIRKVALKIIKLGMDTRQVVARFEAERQALALMDHPNIAKVLDAGAVGAADSNVNFPVGGSGGEVAGRGAGWKTGVTGRPYFVMELVHGVPITEYCDKNKLATKERLELFIPVCQAIQHAHQKGIIHRDIKPSNVMVTLHDGVPVPKVIDFGVAKATNQRLTEKTLFTHYAQMIGTPAYMSPEQAEMSGLDIDTRSDVYSLGVLLYELLTGTTPFDAKELLSKGYAEMQRIIAQQEPPKPSTRMSTLRDEERTVVATNRSMEASALNKMLKGDLDWIVMKALEKDRTRRYETANGFATDLRRHLTDEPVTAGAPSTGYRFRKFARRNKVALTVAATIVAVLIIATGISVWQAVRATKAEALAKQRLTESEAITKFLTGVFQSPDPSRDGRTITVAETLDKAVTNLDRDLANQPARRSRLQLVLGKTYTALGLFRDAIPLLEKVRDHYRANSGLEHDDTLEAMGNLASAYDDAGRWDEALKVQEEVLTLHRKVRGPEHPNTLQTMGNLATYYFNAGRWDKALKVREEVLTLHRKVLGPEHSGTLGAMQNLARSYANLDRVDKAVALLEEVLPLRLKLNGPEHPDTLHVMTDLANSFQMAKRHTEALKLREEILVLDRKVFGPEHPDTLDAMNNLALSNYDTGRLVEALKLQVEVLALGRKVLGPEHPDTLDAMINLAASYRDTGRLGDSTKLLEEGLPLNRKVNGPTHPVTLRAMEHLAAAYAAAGRLDEALKLQEEVVTVRRKVLGPEHPDTLAAMQNLGIAYSQAGHREEGLKLTEEALSLNRKVLGPEHADTLLAMQYLASAYDDAGRKDEALKLTEELLTVHRKMHGPEHPDTLGIMIGLAGSYRKADRADDAIKLGLSSLEIYRRVAGSTNSGTLNAMTELAISYQVAHRTGEAIALEEESLRLKRQQFPSDHPLIVESMDNLATCYEQSNRKPEAEALRRELAELKVKAENQKPGNTQSPTAPAKP